MKALNLLNYDARAVLAQVNFSPLSRNAVSLAVPQCTRTFYTTTINGETAVCGMRVCDNGNSVSININCV